MLAVLDALGVERATSVGHDWGAWSGLLAALRAPRPDRPPALAVRAHPGPIRRLRQLAVFLSLPGARSACRSLGRRVAGPVSRAMLQAGRGADRLGAADVALFADQSLRA